MGKESSRDVDSEDVDSEDEDENDLYSVPSSPEFEPLRDKPNRNRNAAGLLLSPVAFVGRCGEGAIKSKVPADETVTDGLKL